MPNNASGMATLSGRLFQLKFIDASSTSNTIGKTFAV